MARPSFRLDRYSLAVRIAVSPGRKLVMNGKGPSGLARGLVDEIAIPAAEEDQRRRDFGAGRMSDDPDDEDDVIAPIVVRIRRAFEVRERVRDQRRLGMTDRNLDLAPFVGESACELIGDVLLVPGQDVDGKAPGFEHRRQAACLAVDAE